MPADYGSSADRAAAAAHRDARSDLALLNEIARIATLDLALRPMLQRITDALRRQFDWEFVACVSIDAERARFVCEALSTELPTAVHVGYSRELGSGVVGEVAATGRPVLLDDVRGAENYVQTTPGVRSELCMPVRHGGRTVAILNLESTRVAEFNGQLPLLATVAEQVAGAIANAHHHEELERRAHLLGAVAELSRAALEAGDLEPLLDRMVEYIHRHLDVALAAVVLVDVERQENELAAQAGSIRLDAARGARWHIHSGLVGRTVELGEPQLALDVRTDPDYVSLNDRVVAEYVVPIRWRDELLGVLDLESTHADTFSPQNLVAFRTFADQLAGAIGMAAMNRRLEEANERLREANQALERLSALDGLTGIANRRQLDAVLESEWRRASRSGAPVSLLLIDIDDFKRYNDAYGHQQGDDCLRRVASTLAAGLQRASDLVARYGGEEFAAVLPGTDPASAEGLAEALRGAVEALGIPHERSTVGASVTISVGLAGAVPRTDLAPALLLEAADRALYRAKRQGKNRVLGERLQES